MVFTICGIFWVIFESTTTAILCTECKLVCDFSAHVVICGYKTPLQYDFTQCFLFCYANITLCGIISTNFRRDSEADKGQAFLLVILIIPRKNQPTSPATYSIKVLPWGIRTVCCLSTRDSFEARKYQNSMCTWCTI